MKHARDNGQDGCELFLVRHARTAWNAQKMMQGHRDVPLDEEGQRMAQALAQSPLLTDVQVIYSSDLSRAWQTAEPLAQRLGLKVNLDQRLREGRWGVPHPSNVYHMLPFPVEAENQQLLAERVRQCMSEIVRDNPGKRVLVMTHGGPIRHTLAATLGEDRAKEVQPTGATMNTAICHLSYANGKWSVKRLFDCDHLIAAGIELVEHDAG